MRASIAHLEEQTSRWRATSLENERLLQAAQQTIAGHNQDREAIKRDRDFIAPDRDSIARDRDSLMQDRAALAQDREIDRPPESSKGPDTSPSSDSELQEVEPEIALQNVSDTTPPEITGPDKREAVEEKEEKDETAQTTKT
ncbi:unnamed protein product [Phytophthora fragariaefolia]|uniref:Unnamed protein product n=1 Tax=Phytophthora fragariaefolia TaxID=1490495 RepID=A0A9W6XB65_9STRA|nr:unnamed protein product [Phytophthora fragariaefolia]